jgi:amino acid permease
MVSISYGFQSVGLAMGTCLLILCMFCTWYTLNLLVISAQTAHPQNLIPRQLRKSKGEPSISSIGKVLGISILSDLVVLITCLAYCVSYLVSIGETMPLVMRDIRIENAVLTSNYFWICLASIFILMISFEDDVSSIWWYGTGSLACAFYVAGLIIVGSFNSNLYWEHMFFPEWKVQVFDTLPIFVFAFCCHQNVGLIYVAICYI